MDRLEFCRHAIQIRSLMELKTVLDSRDIDIEKLIQLLTYLIFYSRAFIYEYGGKDPMPRTRICSLQYSFHLFLNTHPQISQQLSPANQISVFLRLYRDLTEKLDAIKGTIIISDLMADENLRILNIFEKIFAGDQYETTAISPSGPLTYVQFDENLFLAREFDRITNSVNQFCIDEYGRLTYSNTIKYDGDVGKLRKLGLEVLRDIINEGLTSVNPKLILNGDTVQGEWELRHQMEGIYMELFVEIAKDSQYRLCANPTCGRFFSASRNRSNKKFCCHECAVLQAKRNERKRNRSKDS